MQIRLIICLATPNAIAGIGVVDKKGLAVTDMNLFQIGSGWSPESKGGAETMFYNLFQDLQESGFSVRGVVPGSEAVKRDTGGKMHGFMVDGASLPKRGLAIRRSARDSFMAARPDVVASHFALYTLPILDRISGYPLVVHFHGPWAMESSIEGGSAATVLAKKTVESLVYRRAQRVIVLSEAFGTLLQDYYKVPAANIRVVPGGVDCDRFDAPASRAEARATLGWDPDRPILFAVRRLVKRMGLDRLVDAMAMLRRSPGQGSRDVMLHIAGSGPERATLEAQVKALGLEGCVRFEGFMADEMLPLAYRAADVTLVPTVDLEGFGLVAVESLAAGTPVLVTRIGGLPEVVSGLSGAMVLDGSDAQSIADGIARTLADTAFLPGAADCRSYARNKFDWRVIVPQIADVYREVL